MGSRLKRKQEERGIEEDTGRVAVLCVLRAVEEGGGVGYSSDGYWFGGGTQMCGDI